MTKSNNTKAFIQKGEQRSRYRLLLVNLFILILGFGLSRQSSVQEELDALSLNSLFKARAALGRDVEIDKRLFVFNLDDKTTNILNMPDLGFAGWAYVLDTILERKPKAVVIDKVFSLNLGKASLDKLQALLKKYDVPVYVGAFFTDNELSEREPWSSSGPSDTKFDLESLSAVRRHFAYGPHRDLKDYFRAAGHISLDRNARIYPAVPLNNGSVITHLSLLTGSPSFVSKDKLSINGQEVSLDSKGRLQINLVSADAFRQRAMSIAPLLKDNEQRKALLTAIGSEDVVLILPQMFTGNTDWKDSPRGPIEGGYILGSMINSVLNGQWLNVFQFNWILVLAAIFLVAIIPLFVPVALSWTLYLVVSLAMLALMILSFTWFSFYLPLVSVWLVFTAIYLPNTFFTARFRENRSLRLIQSLGSSMGPENIKNLAQNPDLVLQKPNQREMSILFLDMVGFSLVSDRTTAQDVFSNLKEIIQAVETIVHSYSGIVDKVLGDGVMCFFGSSIESTTVQENDHAERAVACAVAIQELCVKLCISNYAKGRLVFPFRVGVNTAQVYFGDIGGDNRIEFTCIGPGVNFAARLESACEPFKVLIGQDTYSRINAKSYSISEKRIQIKHYSEYFDSFEIDPFPVDKSLYQEAMTSYRKFHGIESREPRYLVSNAKSIRILLGGQEAKLSDYSQNGLGLDFPILMSRSSLLDVQILSNSHELSLESIRSIFVVEIKQSLNKRGIAHLGVEYRNLDQAQRDALFQFLSLHTMSQKEIESI